MYPCRVSHVLLGSEAVPWDEEVSVQDDVSQSIQAGACLPAAHAATAVPEPVRATEDHVDKDAVEQARLYVQVSCFVRAFLFPRSKFVWPHLSVC